jgi:hypothetical protein
LEGDWDLRFVGESGSDILRVTGFNASNSIWLNSSYVLEKRPLLRASMARGWHNAETTYQWTGRDSDTATIILESFAEDLSVDLLARYSPLAANNRILIYVNGNKIADCPDNRSCHVTGIRLAKGSNALEFRTENRPRLSGNGNFRSLGFAFSSIEIRRSEP